MLPAAAQPEPKPASHFAQTYAYDAIGNRTKFTQTGDSNQEVAYQTNALNQYSQIKENLSGTASLREASHDADGNLLEDHRNRYTWNTENRLVKVEAKDGSSVSEYAYDYQGRRTTKRTATGGQPEVTTTFVYDGWNLLAEIKSEALLQPKASSLTLNRSEANSGERGQSIK